MIARTQAFLHAAWIRFRAFSAYALLFLLVLLGVLAVEGVFDRARLKRIVAAFREPAPPPPPVVYQPQDLANQVREFETSQKTARKEVEDRRAELEASEGRLRILQAELGPREQALDRAKKDHEAERAAYLKSKAEAETLATSEEYTKFLKIVGLADAKTAAELLRGRELNDLKRILLDLKNFNAAEILDIWMKDPGQKVLAQDLAKYLTRPPAAPAPAAAPPNLASTPAAAGQ